jgi:glycosyltransferase involved in cell wall biosynthesis
VKQLAALVPRKIGTAPGQRLRMEQWAPYLEDAGWDVVLHPFESDELYEIFYEPGRAVAKAGRLLDCYRRLVTRVVRGLDADVVYVLDEAALIGPSLPERLARRRAPVLVYDLDDPWWVPYESEANGLFRHLKFSGKTRSIMRMSDHVIAINGLIAGYASRFNPSVAVVPCLVDADRHRPVPRAGGGIRIGWIGSQTAAANLRTVAEPLRTVQQRTGARVRVIGATAPDLPGVDVELVPWSEDTEVARLAECDIGIVPVRDVPWTHWKYYFKTVQCMAMGLPVVAQAMGSNTEVIDDGVDGFLVRRPEEWAERLDQLVGDEELRNRMGAAARQKVLERYSVSGRIDDVVALFEGFVTSGR